MANFSYVAHTAYRDFGMLRMARQDYGLDRRFIAENCVSVGNDHLCRDIDCQRSSEWPLAAVSFRHYFDGFIVGSTIKNSIAIADGVRYRTGCDVAFARLSPIKWLPMRSLKGVEVGHSSARDVVRPQREIDSKYAWPDAQVCHVDQAVCGSTFSSAGRGFCRPNVFFESDHAVSACLPVSVVYEIWFKVDVAIA